MANVSPCLTTPFANLAERDFSREFSRPVRPVNQNFDIKKVNKQLKTTSTVDYHGPATYKGYDSWLQIYVRCDEAVASRYAGDHPTVVQTLVDRFILLYLAGEQRLLNERNSSRE